MPARSEQDNPMNYCPDDSVCYHCAKPLPDIPPLDGKLARFPESNEEYFAFEGFCSASCAAMSLSEIKSNEYTKEFMQRIARSCAK